MFLILRFCNHVFQKQNPNSQKPGINDSINTIPI